MTMVMAEEQQRPRKRTKTRGGLMVTDTELIERLKVPERVARQALEMLDRDGRTGFPPKQPLWGNRRYWPAVEKWLERHSGLMMESSPRDHQ